MKFDPSKLSNQQLIKKSLVTGISWALRARPPKGQSPGPGFIVIGTAEQALRNAHAVLTDAEKKTKPERRVSTHTDLWIVFYAHTSGNYHWVTDVQRSGKEFVVTWQSVPHSSANATNHFAFIPTGPLSEGTYNVQFKQAPAMDEKGRATTLPDDVRQRIISGSFTFDVRK